MEEKVLVHSKQYNIKKFVKIFSCSIIVLSIIASILMYFSSYAEIVNIAKENYENDYLPSYERYVETKETFINDYNDILKTYDTEEKLIIYCKHTEYVTKKTYYNKQYYTYEDEVPMTKSEFLEVHPTAESYSDCYYSYKVGYFTVYEDFNEYKEIMIRRNFDLDEKIESLIPLCVNLLIPIIFLIYLWLRSYSLTITDKRVYGKTAFGKRMDLPFDSVSSVGTSALKGVAVGTSSGRINFKLIKNQSEIHNVISKLLAERQNVEKKTTEATVNQTIVENSSADELKKFKELLDSGIITQEEFDAKKKQLLNF